MARKQNYNHVRLKSTESNYTYHTKKSRKIKDRLEMRKYDPTLRRHVTFKEER
jgi:large subunit ribosomal protein L33